MRIVTLPDDREQAEKAFTALYLALLNAEAVKGKEQVIRAAKLVDLFEDSSHEETKSDGQECRACGRGKEYKVRKLNDNVSEIALEDAEFDLLKKHMDAMSWAPGQAKQARFGFEAMEAAKEAKAKDLKVVKDEPESVSE